MAYTQLSPLGVPWERYTFVAKKPASAKGVGPFTWLSVLAVPGMRHSFAAKTPFIPVVVEGGGWIDPCIIEDNELLEIISIILMSGRLK